MKYLVLLLSIFALQLLAKEAPQDRPYKLVFYNTEIRSITITKDTRLEYPMVDGHVDWIHPRLIKPNIDFDAKGGHYEPVREK